MNILRIKWAKQFHTGDIRYNNRIWGKWGIVMTDATIKAEHNQTCIVCSRETQEQGINIWDHFICRNCEGEMVATDVYDEKYPFFIRQMRKIWLKENA